VYLASRLVVWFIAVTVSWLGPTPSVSTVLTSWDGAWYRFIATSGYPAAGTTEGVGNRFAFFPAYPAVIRGFDILLPGGSAIAALCASFVVGAAATVAVWLMARDVVGRDTADDTALLFVFFPVAMVLTMAYSEGLLIAASAFSLWALRRQMWAFAGVAAMVAGGTRFNGLVVVGICMLTAGIELVRRRSPTAVLALLLPPVGFGLFVAMQRARTGDWLAFFHTQSIWGQDFEWFRPVFRALGDLLTRTDAWHNPVPVLGTAALVYFAGGLALMWWQKGVPWQWWAFTIGTGVLALTPGMPISSLRYMYPAVPILVATAVALRDRRWVAVAAASSAVVMGALAVYYFVGSLQIARGLPAFQP
jgi:Gpi18-like mannosyltransferase